MSSCFRAWWCRFKKGGRGWSNPEKLNRKGSADAKAKAELRTPQQVRFLITFECCSREHIKSVLELEPRCLQQETPCEVAPMDLAPGSVLAARVAFCTTVLSLGRLCLSSCIKPLLC